MIPPDIILLMIIDFTEITSLWGKCLGVTRLFWI